MKNIASDIRFMGGLFIAHLLMYFTFQDKSIFWYIFSASLLFLISYSIIMEELEDKASFGTIITYGAFSGGFLYVFFWLGYSLIDLLNLPFLNQVNTLYGHFSPSLLWHYIVLILIIIPGEEIFWRGFVQKRLMKHTNIALSIVFSTVLYASVHFYSGYWMLAFAALIAGLFWGWLYAWKRSIPLVIVSHLIFDLFMFVILPFK
ncbi:CPBP family intramembrane metalloprotease [Bacillus sp. ISL-47]|uniref:CPBP family intramembrane glutamic endopeptidase n=1 Tax=Bacillus sp. ISL-47 TaxID=2819130 RepID=UPI001BE7F1E6|nr:type II CAAX endopeptidase family protein [Bacillus sp. ISL-47]MBT2687796.1 CPBP family intramembrane metalloprotease [Bacillus sp. ISL-47]MBT2708127.1 CPBP family intramembrane metalloprotease [Pseudomonas sp. ISL-84]